MAKLLKDMVSAEDICQAVRAHAAEYYTFNGWDIVSETFDDADILEAVGGATTLNGAYIRVGKVARLLHEQRREVQSTAF